MYVYTYIYIYSSKDLVWYDHVFKASSTDRAPSSLDPQPASTRMGKAKKFGIFQTWTFDGKRFES